MSEAGVPTRPPEQADEHFWISKDGERIGPLSGDQVVMMLQTGALAVTDYAFQDGWTDWRALGDLAVFTHSQPASDQVGCENDVRCISSIDDNPSRHGLLGGLAGRLLLGAAIPAVAFLLWWVYVHNHTTTLNRKAEEAATLASNIPGLENSIPNIEADKSVENSEAPASAQAARRVMEELIYLDPGDISVGVEPEVRATVAIENGGFVTLRLFRESGLSEEWQFSVAHLDLAAPRFNPTSTYTEVVLPTKDGAKVVECRRKGGLTSGLIQEKTDEVLINVRTKADGEKLVQVLQAKPNNTANASRSSNRTATGDPNADIKLVEDLLYLPARFGFKRKSARMDSSGNVVINQWRDDTSDYEEYSFNIADIDLAKSNVVSTLGDDAYSSLRVRSKKGQESIILTMPTSKANRGFMSILTRDEDSAKAVVDALARLQQAFSTTHRDGNSSFSAASSLSEYKQSEIVKLRSPAYRRYMIEKTIREMHSESSLSLVSADKIEKIVDDSIHRTEQMIMTMTDEALRREGGATGNWQP